MAGRQRAATALPKLIQSLRKECPKPPSPPTASATTHHQSMRPPLPAPLHLPSLRRAFSLYDQINLIDNVPDDQLRFQGYTETGFTVNRVEYEGSLLCIGNLVLSWSPKSFSQVTPHSLSIFQTVRPIPEILILGCGRHIQPIDLELRNFIRSTGMKLEAIDSRNAASTYNILNEEGRIVAAALLPYGVTS
uniref:NADH dehydrogenase [ubiquinone] 1 alpha subcomplex assembly factor 3 n=1 Tax=Rhizophora mucronata TaxID=61149 RepID=A0A2P2QLL4_RHIMU